MLPSFGIVGEHPSIKTALQIIRRVAVTDATVLITGESGTGKEIAARSIHHLSLRADRPFVPINCAAIPENLLENELYGRSEGATTGNHSTRAGLFQVADHGTVLLDEVGEMSLAQQAKLLRVLQEGAVRPTGSDQPVNIDVRVIASTTRDLAPQVESGAFYEELFFRLHMVSVHLPPLRVRRSDVPLLINHFLERFNRKHESSVTINRAAMIYLWEYDWPGNIREMRSLVEKLVILKHEDAIDVKHLPFSIRSFVSDKKNPQPTLAGGRIDMPKAMKQLEYRLIDEAMRLADGNQSAAARMLGLNRTTLVQKLRHRRVPVATQEIRTTDSAETVEELIAAHALGDNS